MARHDHLSKREHQAMDIVYRLGKATAEEIQDEMPAPPPSYSAVRALLSILAEKKLLKYTREGRRYVMRPAIAPERARDTALKKSCAPFRRITRKTRRLTPRLKRPQTAA
ncbi:MAG: BlaI/MecI/CopY family transcriptional regulator [Verrucomicrobiaceae bacterium]|nr:BlaI/MecI/CopY family transcriptional regulator [Verrucomicrobiaceae bacterium]